jgi:acyl-CoA dehydrogenase
MKQQTTERARHVLNDAMDIQGGSAICLGQNNFLEKFYKSAPIGITVEGSNTLTRSLIIFSQGLNKSHPHIFPLLTSILDDNIKDFRKHFNSLIFHSISLYVKSLFYSINILDHSLEKEILRFATLTNFVALKGGLLKKEQMLSGSMADQFGNLYMAISVKYYAQQNNIQSPWIDYVIDRLIYENRNIMNNIIDNLGAKRYFIQHLKTSVPSRYYDNEQLMFNEFMYNPKIIEEVKKNIFTNDTILEKLETTTNQINDGYWDTPLRNDVIQVGEYSN